MALPAGKSIPEKNSSTTFYSLRRRTKNYSKSLKASQAIFDDTSGQTNVTMILIFS